MKKVSVEIPASATDLVTLAGKLKAKHDELADASPLKGIDWATFGPSITQATDYDAQADKLHRQGEKFTEKRDRLMLDVADCVRSCRDVLLGLNRRNPRALADFDFVVNENGHTKKNGNANGGTTPANN